MVDQESEPGGFEHLDIDVGIAPCEHRKAAGLGEVTDSDDLLGFMRGFLYAGARSLLLSLWNVNDESTTALMGYFYREWQKGAAKSRALRSAMLSVRDELPHPFYWAPFILVGNP